MLAQVQISEHSVQLANARNKRTVLIHVSSESIYGF